MEGDPSSVARPLVVPRRTQAWVGVALGAAAVLLAAFALRALTGAGGSQAQERFATWVSDVLIALTVAVCAWRAFVDSDERRIWGLVAAGIAAWGLGNAYWEHSLTSGVSLPNPSPADLGYLCFYPLMYLAVIAARRPDRGGRPGIAVWLDGLIAAAACATVAAALVVGPVVDATSGESVGGALTNLAYPIADATLMAMLLVTAATGGWRSARGLIALAAGLAIFAIADSLYIVENANGTYQAGGILDAGWLLALVLMAAGAAAVGRRPKRPRARMWGRRGLVPSLGGLAALAVIALQPVAGFGAASLGLGSLTLTLVVLRLALSLRETETLLAARSREAELDSLTGLANRRKLLEDLHHAAASASAERPVLLVLFDLDGFKVYNDTFGHAAGDALLVQVAAGLREALGERGRAYRMGGDEFCALAPADPADPEVLAADLAAAMARHGEGFSVTASFGCSLTPRDGTGTTELIRRADDEMYARKGRSRPGTERQVQDALTAALGARDPEMETHATRVARQAVALGRHLGLDGADLRVLLHAAALHDIGKIAIPDLLLEKEGELGPDDRRFLQTHPLIAQRIVSAAPALGYAAHIVRSVQERWDGSGYPDGLAGEATPLPARIVAVCNAYQAMTCDRPDRPAMSHEQAIEELKRCSGSQFDPTLAAAFVELFGERGGADAEPGPAAEPQEQIAAGGRRLEARIDYQADHDLLTGLLNRRRFTEQLDRMLRYASRYRRSGALLVLDFDNLKLVNDLHGHAAGDVALTTAAREIVGRVRGSDVVARLGGDEFAVALSEVGERQALAVADDIRRRLARREIDPPLHLSGGIALFEGDQQLVPDDLLAAADVALSDAKQAGKDQIRVYRGDAGGALDWVQRVRTALAEEHLVLHAQPIVRLDTGGIAYRELLVRMRADDGDLIPPSSFIPTAERFGMINDLDRWVAGRGLALAGAGTPVSINLSASSIGDPAILDLVARASARGLPAGTVIFEITETAAMSNMEEARDFAAALGSLGCDVALDDFGTGFGSFSYLKHLPTRYLKIDIEFVRELTSNDTDQRVVRSITDVGHSLGKRIIAEGVETRAAAELLLSFGVDYGQGVYFGAATALPEGSSAPARGVVARRRGDGAASQ